jgi:hypothetical protein
MEVPEVRFATSGDVSIAFSVLGDGPFDLVFVSGWVLSVLGSAWDGRARDTLRRLASFSRRRGDAPHHYLGQPWRLFGRASRSWTTARSLPVPTGLCPREESNLRTRFRKPREHDHGVRLRDICAGSGAACTSVGLGVRTLLATSWPQDQPRSSGRGVSRYRARAFWIARGSRCFRYGVASVFFRPRVWRRMRRSSSVSRRSPGTSRAYIVNQIDARHTPSY